MHDHQSDWKSLYSDLDDMNSVDDLDDPLMGDKSTGSLINSQELNHAKSVFRQMKKEAVQALAEIPGLKPKDKQAVEVKLNDLFTRAQINLEDVDYRAQIKSLEHKTRIQLHRIIINRKFAGKINSIIAKLRDVSLTKNQRIAAISEMKSIAQYTHDNLIKSQTMASLDDSYTSGINSIDGALVKYIADVQMNVSHLLKTVATKVHQNIEAQPNLNVAAKYLAYQKIDTVKTGVMGDLMSTSSFDDLERVKRDGMNRLKSILNDKNKVLENLTAFNQFADRLKSIVNSFAQLSSNTKLLLEQKIDDYQKGVEAQVQQIQHNTPDNDFNYCEHHLSIMVVNAINKACQQQINSQKTLLTAAQQDSFMDQLNSTIAAVHGDFEGSHLRSSIEDSLVSGVKKLGSLAERIDEAIYKNQIDATTHDVKGKIEESYQLSDNEKHHLRAQIEILSKHLLENPAKMSADDAKKRLYDAFHKQVNNMMKMTMHHLFDDLYKQIQASHLSMDQAHEFLMHLNQIRQKSDLDYSSAQLLIKNVLHQSLVVDKNENLHRMTKLNEDLHRQISSFDIASQLDSSLQDDMIRFSQRINDSAQLSVADHEEQMFESVAYRKLYQLYSGTDSPQAEALRSVIVASKKIHQQVNAAVLDPKVNWRINEEISKHTNQYLYRLLSIHEARSLKEYVADVVKKVQQEIPKAVAYLQKEYVNQIDQFFKKIDYQLKTYSVSWSVLDKADLIQSHAVSKIKQATSLLKIEYAKQLGDQQVNGLLSDIVSHENDDKKRANQKIDKLTQSIEKQLDVIKKDSERVNYAFLNRVFRFVNLAKYHVNQCLNTDLPDTYHRYARLLGKVLRQSFLREWLLISRRAQITIKNLSNVPAEDKRDAQQSVHDLKLNVTLNIQKCDQTDLDDVVKKGNAQLEKLITQTIYLDPVKKRARQDLSSLIDQIKDKITTSFSKKTAKTLTDQLNNISGDVEEQLRMNDDEKVRSIYKVTSKELHKFELKLVHKIQQNQFTKYTKHFNKQLDGMKMLADREVKQSNAKFNRYYHKTVYEIANADDMAKCQKSEQAGEKMINKILVKDQAINDSKKKFYQAVQKNIKQAKHQIMSLKSLQKKDKHDSNKLLDQIQKQTYQNVKQALSRNEMTEADDKCHKMIKQVIDKVSSASVLVAAIKSANTQISQSKLDKTQKSATLKQINQIIDRGIQSQFTENKKGSDSRRTHHHFTHHHDQHRPDEFDDFGMNSGDTKESQHHSLLSSLRNAFKNFFRWLGGVLARAL